METKMLILVRKTVLLCLSFLVFLVPAQVMSQDIDLNCPTPGAVNTLTVDFGSELDISIGVQNSSENVYWAFNDYPPAAILDDPENPSSFEFDGVIVTLPAGAPANAVSDVLTLSITGTPTTSFFFDVLVTEADSPFGTCIQRYELIFSASSTPMDLVLVLDRSGSMLSRVDPSSPTNMTTRWGALKTAVSNFGIKYQSLDRDGDRLGITYFSTNITPPPVSYFDDFVPFSNIGTDLQQELDGLPNPTGLTAMAAGLKNAQEKLSDANKARSILLFTDGVQNPPASDDLWVNEDGQGYEDRHGNPDATTFPEGIKIFTIGITTPSGRYNTTLQNLALNNRGSYNITESGETFSFQGGVSGGELSSEFTNNFVDMLSEFSPQIVGRTVTQLTPDTALKTLQTFPLNRRVDKLLLEFVFDRNLATPELEQIRKHIRILKDGVPVNQYVRPSWVGNSTNTLLLTIDFNAHFYERESAFYSTYGGGRVTSEGDWSIQLADVSNLRINHCGLTVLADDHRLHMRGSYGDVGPKVNDVLPLSLTLDWLSHPIEDATVEAIILRPGEDLGDLLANHPSKVEVSDGDDADLPGTQKFEHLWATDSAFREQLKKTENLVVLNHTENGNYEGSFNGLNVAGVYQLVFQISGDHPDAGRYQRMLSRSFYTSFSSVDISQSAVSIQLVEGQLIMLIKPKTSYGKFVGPAMGDAFSVSNPNIQISNVVDHQDGSYTITFTGDIGAATTFQLLGQDIYTGKLENVGKPTSIIDRITDWLESIGLPAWTIWILLLLIILILWFIFRKKK